MNDHRYFVTTDEVYEAMRFAVDRAWKYPTIVGTQTCVEPASERPHDSNGRVLKPLMVLWLEWEPVKTMIRDAIEAGFVLEVDEQTYNSLVPKFDRFA